MLDSALRRGIDLRGPSDRQACSCFRLSTRPIVPSPRPCRGVAAATGSTTPVTKAAADEVRRPLRDRRTGEPEQAQEHLSTAAAMYGEMGMEEITRAPD